METRTKRILRDKETTTFLVGEGGEILNEKKESEVITESVSVEPDFVKLYLNDIARLYDLPKSTNKLMFELLRLMGYDNIITLGKWRKEEISKRLNISTGTLANALTKFIEEGIITKKSSCEFLVNPNIFGRGKWKDIRELRIMIEYSPDGRQFYVERKNVNPITM